MCCGRLFDHEVHHCSLFLYSFDSCLFYGASVVRVSVIFIRVCTHVGLFYFRLGLRAFSVVEIFCICKIKTKPTTGRVGVYKQIAGLYVIDF
jgi:hypothetical protein